MRAYAVLKNVEVFFFSDGFADGQKMARGMEQIPGLMSYIL
jgi:hypothetical protein